MAEPSDDILHDLASFVEERPWRLDACSGCSLNAYLNDPELQIKVERLLQTAIQASIDMAFPLISTRGWEEPDDYHDSMDALQRHGILSADLVAKMHELVGLRNALVHTYRRIRHHDVHGHFQRSRETLRQFVRAVLPPPPPSP